MKYSDLSAEKKKALKADLDKEYQALLDKKLDLNMARGVLCREQLDLTQDMLGVLKTPEDCMGENGTDYRNYGLLDGIPAAKKIFAELLGVDCDCVIIGGNSSLNLMYDSISRLMIFGAEDVKVPYMKQGKVKFICPSPGYDRHFGICEAFGIEMIPVDINRDGPDMDKIEELVANDESVKGIWCVPKYSNPTGVVYSDEVVSRFADLSPKAKDFRIFWDNAYIIHSLYGEPAKQKNILEEAKKTGKENMVYVFTSTSKISFPGSGVSVIASSRSNIDEIKNRMASQTIGYDKLNQMRHIRYFGSLDGILSQMKRHAEIIAPKFDMVECILEERLGGLGIADWSKPEGGYFISLNVMPGTAKRVYEMMCELGIKLTPAGNTYPYKKDPKDSNLRIAPTFPPPDELKQASEALCLCTKRAAMEKLI